jgi:hypothetical protein
MIKIFYMLLECYFMDGDGTRKLIGIEVESPALLPPGTILFLKRPNWKPSSKVVTEENFASIVGLPLPFAKEINEHPARSEIVRRLKENYRFFESNELENIDFDIMGYDFEQGSDEIRCTLRCMNDEAVVFPGTVQDFLDIGWEEI